MTPEQAGLRMRWALAGAGALALVAGLSHALAPARPARPCEDPVAGRVLESFCLACHTLDRPGENPLVARLDRARFGTEQAAYESVGRLERLNPSMMIEFSGTEAERRALARCLAELSSGR